MKEIHILFVDDEQDALSAIERQLRKETYAVHVVTNGAEALAVMAKKPIHIIVTDMKMPGMDGLTLLRQVKGLYPNTVRLALSAYLQVGHLLPCINTGEIFRYITKPVNLEDLKQALQDAIDYFLVLKDRMSLVLELKEKDEEIRLAIERQKEVEIQLQRLAIIDDVTELYTRRFLPYFLEHQFEQCKRYGNDMSCIMITLDHFKRIDEAHGHEFGDFVLKEFSVRLKMTISSADLGFRYSGGQFLILCPNTALVKAVILGRKIEQFCRCRPFICDGRSITVIVSIGVASYKRHQPQTAEQLVSMAIDHSTVTQQSESIMYECEKEGET